MNSNIESWLFELEQCLPSGASPKVKDALITVCHRVFDADRALFVRTTNKRSLQKAARTLSLQAEDHNELDATAHLFACLYDHHKKQHPELLEPTVYLPFRDERSLIDDLTPPMATLEWFHQCLHHAHPSTSHPHSRMDHEGASLGHAILTVVFRSGLTSISQFDELLQQPLDKWVVISMPSPLVSVYLPKQHIRVYLLEETILAMHKILKMLSPLSPSKQKKQLRHCLTAWKNYAAQTCPSYLTNNTTS